MEYHIDRRIVLNQDSEFTNLYEWSLQELDAEGNKVGRDQIPWDWTLYFTATELALIDTLAIEPDFQKPPDDETRVVRAKRSIRAKLSPGDPWERGRHNDTAYSMFGTDRTVSSFDLFIETVDEVDPKCTVWGGVSYTTDIDFRDETIEDSIIFYLYVRPDVFAEYAEKISVSAIDEAVLRVSGVDGFYSDWSPAVSTEEIKVLTREKEHSVEIPSDCPLDPPRLGNVREAELYLRRIRKFDSTSPNGSEDSDWLDDDDGDVAEQHFSSSQNQKLSMIDPRAIDLLSSVRAAAWVIAVLLLLILLT